MAGAGSGNLVQWGIEFTLDDNELSSKVKAAKDRTAALAKSIESGTYYQLQRAAITAAKEYDTLIKKSSQLIINEQRLARESERRQRYGRLGVMYSMTERYQSEMQQRGYSPRGMVSGGLLRVGAIGTGMLAGAAAAGGTAVSDTVSGSMKMLGLSASRALVPALATASKKMQDLAHWVDNFVAQNPKLSSMLGTTALVMASIGAVGAGIKSVAWMAGGLRTAGAMVSSAWTAGTGMLATAGMIPRPMPTTAGGATPPMMKGNWTGGTAPTAQMAPGGSKVGSLATAGSGAAMAGVAGRSLLGTAMRTTGYGLAAWGANELLGNPVGRMWDWAMENHPFQNKTIMPNGTVVPESKAKEGKEERRKQAMAGLGLSIGSYSATDYREAAQSAVLSTTPLDAQNFQLEVKNWQELAKEFGVVAEKMSSAADAMKAANQPGMVPPGR